MAATPSPTARPGPRREAFTWRNRPRPVTAGTGNSLGGPGTGIFGSSAPRRRAPWGQSVTNTGRGRGDAGGPAGWRSQSAAANASCLRAPAGRLPGPASPAGVDAEAVSQCEARRGEVCSDCRLQQGVDTERGAQKSHGAPALGNAEPRALRLRLEVQPLAGSGAAPPRPLCVPPPPPLPAAVSYYRGRRAAPDSPAGPPPTPAGLGQG